MVKIIFVLRIAMPPEIYKYIICILSFPEEFNMDYAKESLRLHGEWGGKIEVVATVPVSTKEELSLAYTPGVAQPCLEIKDSPEKVWDYTVKGNLVAVVSDGTAVLGLGNIGPEAGLPVMEGKAVLFKRFADIDAVPLCISKVFKENGKTERNQSIF